MTKWTRAAICAALALEFDRAHAGPAAPDAPQTALDPPAPIQASAVADAPAVADPCCAIPAGTPVVLEIVDTIRSDSAKRGERFRLRLAEPVLAGGVTVLPAGLEGQGEIIHAEPARAGGKAGELLLAARHLDHDGQHVALRGMKLGGGGTSQVQAALAVAIVTGPFGMLVRGGNIEVPGGTHAQAKLAQSLGPTSPIQPSSPTPTGDAITEDLHQGTVTPLDVNTHQE